ncbi:ABC transporter permease [candidate division KSB1 bacterium]
MQEYDKKSKPPFIIKRLLQRLTRNSDNRMLVGDCEEEFSEIASVKGIRYAKRWYCNQLLISLLPFIKHSIFRNYAMFKNYLKVTFRSIKKNKGYSFINISGLAVGMTCFILISLWVNNELSYDNFHENGDRLYRTITTWGTGNIAPNSSWRLGPALKEKYPEVKEFSRVCSWHRSLVKYGSKSIMGDKFFLADASFFTIFSFPFVKGNPETALSDLNSIVISENAAEMLFGNEDPMGKVLYIAENDVDLIVTGVIEEIPDNSHMQFDFAARVELMGEDRFKGWDMVAWSFVMLNPEADRRHLDEKIYDFYREEVNPETSSSLLLQPLRKIHLYEFGRPGIIKQVYAFSIIALIILALACINFMNLSTARSSKRVKEVGLRKVAGSTRKQLLLQFLSESVFFASFSLALALLLSFLILPIFNQFTGKTLNLFSIENLRIIIILVCLAPFVGVFAGSYPAFYLSSFMPVQALKGDKNPASGKNSIRKILTILQFTISTALIVCTLIVHNQMQFIRNIDLGLNRDMVISINNNPDLLKQFEPFKNTLLNISGVTNVTSSAQRPFDVGQQVWINWEGNPNDQGIPTGYTMVDYDFFEAFELEFLLGRSFSKEHPLDLTQGLIINESAQKAMELTSPLGTDVFLLFQGFDPEIRNSKIIGVVKDFHSASMHREIRPFFFKIYRPWHRFTFIKIEPDNITKTISDIEIVFKTLAADYPFNYEFLDEAFDKMYSSERQLGNLFKVFGSLAIFISCLGLLGLASYSAEQKTKEIGVRKVLGASVKQLIFMLSKDFTKWVLLANIIAWPISWFYMNRWLQEFAYKIDISLSIYITAGLLTFIIAIIIVGYQTLKSATADPVKSLKYE